VDDSSTLRHAVQMPLLCVGESEPMAVEEQQEPPAQGTSLPTTAPTAVTPAPPAQAPPTKAETNGGGKSSGTAPATPPVAEAVRPVKYRHQWLQTPTHVEVSVLMIACHCDDAVRWTGCKCPN